MSSCTAVWVSSTVLQCTVMPKFRVQQVSMLSESHQGCVKNSQKAGGVVFLKSLHLFPCMLSCLRFGAGHSVKKVVLKKELKSVFDHALGPHAWA